MNGGLNAPRSRTSGVSDSVRMASFRRLNFKITFLLVISFLVIVALFLSILLPYQRDELRRFVQDRRSFLQNLVDARRGDLAHWYIQGSVAAHWHQFQKTILGHLSIQHATLYYFDRMTPGDGQDSGAERLAVTSDPRQVQRVLQDARAAGVEFESRAVPREDAHPFLAAVGGALWIQVEPGIRLEASLDSGRYQLPEAPPEIRNVGPEVETELEAATASSPRALVYRTLLFLGQRGRETFHKLGHLGIDYSLAELDVQESAIRSLFYSLLGALFLVLLGLLNISLGRSVVNPIRQILEGMRKAGSGNLEVRLEKRSHDEIGLMADQFNQMVQDLQRSKSAIEDYSRTLEQRVADRTTKLMESEKLARELKDHLTAVLRHVQAGVLALDNEGRIVTFNERSGQLLGLKPGEVLNRPASDVLRTSSLEPLYRLVVGSAGGQRSTRDEIKLGLPGKVRTFRAAVTSLEGGGTVVVLDDLTDLIYSKRLVAWREAVERVIHDIKNPLTPVRLSAQQIRVAYEDHSPDLERIVDRGTANILSSVDNLESMLADFSLLYRRPQAEPRPVDVNRLVEQILDEQAPALDPSIVVEKRLDPALPRIMGDPLGLWRLLTNVIQNGLEAMKDTRDMKGKTGRKGTADRAGMFTVISASGERGVRLVVQDQGTGIPPDRLDKLFEPYFTTKPKGTGLGLVIARQIVEDHGGTIEIASEVGQGTTVTIELPGAPAHES